jgi:hypothetical protein
MTQTGTTTAQFAVQHDSEYRSGQTHSHGTFTVDPKPGLCQGRKEGSSRFSFRTVACTNRATRTIKAKPYSYQSGPYADLPGDEVELHVCGTHDLQAKGNRKAAQAVTDRAARAAKEVRTQTASQTATEQVARINTLAGSTVVEVRPRYQDGYASFPIVVVNSAALELALGGAQ